MVSIMADAFGQLSWEDVERVVHSRATNLVEIVLQFLKSPTAPEPRELPEGALTEKRIKDALEKLHKEKKSPDEKRPDREALWAKWLSQKDPNPPSRLKLAELLLELDNPDDPLARQALLVLAKEAPLVWGPWSTLKKTFKAAEARWDIELLAVLAWRFDMALADQRYRNDDRGEIKQATLAYLSRRSWRFLRKIGQAMPEIYPSFAAEVLQHYQDNTTWQQSWVANHIFYHQATGPTVYRSKKVWDPKKRKNIIKKIPRVKKIYDKTKFTGPFPGSVTQFCAYATAWTADSAPLFRLIEAARADRVLTFAIEILEKNFVEELKHIAPEILLRWGSRNNARLQLFVVDLLHKNAATLPPARYREVGLHQLMLTFLESPQQKVRAFAIDYARGYAQDMPVPVLMKLLRDGFDDVKRFVVESLSRRRGAELGLPLLKDLLAIPLTNAMATKKLREDFDKAALTPAWLKELLLSGQRPLWEFSQAYLDREYTPVELTASFYSDLLDDKRLTNNLQKYEYNWIIKYSLDRLGTLPPDKLGLLGAQWVKDALVRQELRDAVQRWIATGVFPPQVLGVEYFQGLVFNEALVSYAFDVLKQDAFKPTEIGVSWCFGILRDERPWLHEKANELLATRFQPDDFDPEGKGDLPKAFSALWRRAVGEGGGEDRVWVRAFAQKYLNEHHPENTKKEAAKETGPKAKIAHKSFPRELYDGTRILDRVGDVAPSQKDPSDQRKDVSFFAQALARLELRRWLDDAKDNTAARDAIMLRVFDLADHAAVNARRFAYTTLAADEEGKGHRLSAKELCAYPERVYALADSRYLPTRQLGEHLIGAHYEELGGPLRVLSLAESVERDVIDFATSLLFRHHQHSLNSPVWRETAPPVVSKRAGLHERPDAASIVVREIRPGRWLKLVEEQGEWLKIEEGGVAGYIKLKDIRQRKPRPNPQGPNTLTAKEALVEFFKRVLFRVPPGRRPQSKGQKAQKGEAAGATPWTQRFESNRSVKQRVMELARDMALADRNLAEMIIELLKPFVRSAIANEARSALSALVRVSRAHQIPLKFDEIKEGNFAPERRKISPQEAH
jgi:hypothetical protein